MSEKHPLVSIGLPVYNGENFIEQAIDSILAQTFKDFELIISDNASNDKTEAICRKYVTKDKRIRYYRNSQNLGAAPNFNRVYELSTGTYFKWLAHDDLCEPEFIERCVHLFEKDDSIVLCNSRVKIIDACGQTMDKTDDLYGYVSSLTANLNLFSSTPHVRFRDIIRPHACFPVFGLIRSSSLKNTSLLGSYAGADRILLAQLALQGRFYEFPEQFLYQRRHLHQSIQGLKSHSSAHRYTYWFDTATKGKLIFPRWQLFWNLITSVLQAPLTWQEQIKCYLAMKGWLKRYGLGMIEDLTIALQGKRV
ncbi:glycosyltransferase family 2 protein [Myxosarcina sp. GI1]|uniref:glycosyltransferase family 2 protein n=1 Tax=Myxosarcina sp. GI1 TaxID=1541065 RepID=UPI00068F13A2|nr:glycosyltransferase family 2 protein [Myxosarcina sp. GI1]